METATVKETKDKGIALLLMLKKCRTLSLSRRKLQKKCTPYVGSILIYFCNHMWVQKILKISETKRQMQRKNRYKEK